MGGKSSTSSQAVTIPPEVLARYNAVNARAETAASTPFQKYSDNPNDFVAPMNATQNAGIDQTKAAAGAAQPYYGAATSTLTNANASTQPYYGAATSFGLGSAQAVNPEELQINKYMNPYIGSVLRTQSALLNQQNEQQQAGQTGNAIRSGAFGGDRAGIAAANLGQQQTLANQKVYSDILNRGYDTALGTAQQQQGVNLSAGQANRAALAGAGSFMSDLGGKIFGQGAMTAQQLAALGAGAQEAGLQGGKALLSAGQTQQETEQAGKTAMYNQFLQGKSYPFQVAQFLANIAEGTGSLSGSTTTTTQPGGFFSDERLKENIEEIGRTNDGQPIYRYNYKGDDKRTQIGLLAQDVERSHPEAVGLAGGYKTVDYDKATRDSMGGVVSEGDDRMGFAGGGAPDYSDMLSAHSGMYRNMPGFSPGAGLAGGMGYVPPAASTGTHQLATAGQLPQQKSMAQHINEVAQMGENLDKGWKTAKGVTAAVKDSDTYGKVRDWAGNVWNGNQAASNPVENATPDEPEGLAAGGMPYGGESPAGGGNDFQLMPNAAGLVPRGAFADGGMPYAENPKIDIPNEKPETKLALPDSQPSQGRNGMQDVMDVAKIAAMFFMNRGGVAGGRHGYATDGAVDDENVPYDKSFAHAFSESPVGHLIGGVTPNLLYNGGASLWNFGTEMVGGPKVPYIEHPFSKEPNILDNWDGDMHPQQEFKEDSRHGLIKRPPVAPAAAAKTPARLPAAPSPGLSPQDQRGQLAANVMSQAGEMPGDYATAPVAGLAPQAAAPVDQYADLSPEQRSVMNLPGAAAGQPGVAAVQPGAVGAKPAGLAGGQHSPNDTTAKSVEPSFLEKLKSGFEKAGMTKAENVIPLLTGIAAMGTAPTRSFGVAAAAGVGAGAQAWMPAHQAQANIEQTQAKTGYTSAQTDYIASQTGLSRVEAAKAWQDVMKGGFFNANGVPQVMTLDGKVMPFSAWASMKDHPPVFGQSQLLASGNLPEIPVAKLPSQKVPQPKSVAPTSMNEPSDQEYAPVRDMVEQVNSGMRPVETIRQNNEKVLSDISSSSNAASVNRQNLSDLSTAITSIPRESPLSGGPFQNLLKQTVSGWNQAMRAANAPPSLLIDEGNMTQAIIQNKIANGLAFANATAAGQHAYQALTTAAEAIPNGEMPRDAALHLTARMMINNQRAIDLDRFERAARMRASREGIGYAYDAETVRNSFNTNRSRSYEQDINALSQLLDSKPIMDGLMSGKLSRSDVDKMLRTPGITRYVFGQ